MVVTSVAPPRGAPAGEDKQIVPPSRPGEWSISQVESALGRPLPSSCLKEKKMGGQVISYIPWHGAAKILGKYCPGWGWSVESVQLSSDRLFLTGVLSIPTSDGVISRSATGTEELNCSSYGDPSSNAESMAFRRACAKFKLGLYLYEK